MALKHTTWIVIVLLLAAAVAAPVAASCNDCANKCGCCGTESGCPRPAPQSEQRARCCGGPAIPPPTDATFESTPTPVPARPACESPFIDTDVPFGDVASDAPAPDPPPVALFTLHAALLI